jgi:uncharacterized protein
MRVRFPRLEAREQAARPEPERHGAQDHTGEGNALGQPDSPMQDLSWLVTDFAERVPDVEHAVAVSSDGVPLAVSGGVPPDRTEHLSAITSGLVSLVRGVALIFGCGAVSQSLVTMERGVLVIAAVSDGSSLAVLAGSDCDLDLIAYEMTVLTEQAGSVLTPDARRPPETAEERA